MKAIWQRFNRLFEIKSRKLSAGERRLAESVFGPHLQLDAICIVAHRAVLKNYAISPNGHIYFNPKNWCEDFSKMSLGKQSWFIHELTHVWQIQQGVAVVRKALFDRKYHYVLEQGKQFLQYGVEQQAQMVQDYFIKKMRGEECGAYEACIPFLTQKA
ncbi:type IV secretion protein Rhs [Acinetobacter sp.]|uniref:type IV secretion protein Rhs n=1 Tax=Acinetobacter sp. TaxID=472 RepID=UPI002649D003|nr:type IV secretion protein Rhs [Acinetobacter sp.]MDN5511828.1 type IV secretion protein Rhs [Acinetobacter sp.]MDN5524630.1 type IV secretion protein Rhs [Acinetobacter sp.]